MHEGHYPRCFTSYLMSELMSRGWNCTSKVTSMPGEMYPYVGVMEKSGANFPASHLNFAPMSPVKHTCV